MPPTFGGLTVPTVLGAGVLDGLNPCAFALLGLFATYTLTLVDSVTSDGSPTLLARRAGFLALARCTSVPCGSLHFLIGLGLFTFLSWLGEGILRHAHRSGARARHGSLDDQRTSCCLAGARPLSAPRLARLDAPSDGARRPGRHADCRRLGRHLHGSVFWRDLPGHRGGAARVWRGSHRPRAVGAVQPRLHRAPWSRCWRRSATDACSDALVAGIGPIHRGSRRDWPSP